ncbi:MAG: 4'-phosphopantetheinyl transferase superfamily protein [Alphaproteobacteria bacterium]|nr:4'-phosphopantetheinyl transferase superfamily protein [Alphaproteobacteria bacterium]MBP9777403.1 4'-phosphopantetheinyl transferase superfamily protein [Alphaproteobacteria bacterium]
MKLKLCTLKSDEVHIWSASLSEAKNDVAYFASLLSKDEHEQANSFRFYKDQKQYTISRGILRSLLAGYLEEAPQTIEIAYGLWRKPYLAQEKFLHFNVSHSRDYALYAFTRSYEVGIDLEHIDTTLDIENIALSIFSPTELNYWNTLSSEHKIDVFFKHWVCKEAFLKASGKGWLENKKELPYTKVWPQKQQQIDNLLKSKITYPYCFKCIPGYSSALFIDGPSLRLLYYVWDQDS